jgi:hypothetical protein
MSPEVLNLEFPYPVVDAVVEIGISAELQIWRCMIPYRITSPTRMDHMDIHPRWIFRELSKNIFLRDSTSGSPGERGRCVGIKCVVLSDPIP